MVFVLAAEATTVSVCKAARRTPGLQPALLARGRSNSAARGPTAYKTPGDGLQKRKEARTRIYLFSGPLSICFVPGTVPAGESMLPKTEAAPVGGGGALTI